MKILSLCGSIRESSSSGLLLKAFREVLTESSPVAASAISQSSPDSIVWNDVDLKSLPYFDPDHQFDGVPGVIAGVRKFAQDCDYIVIATPEYAHGIPGILKNALEWLICEETMKKKVVLFVVSPSGGEFVLPYLTETLRTMDLLPSESLTMIVTNARNQLPRNGAVDPALKVDLVNLSQRL